MYTGTPRTPRLAPRSYLTAGIAAVGVGTLALAPVQPIPDRLTLAPLFRDLGNTVLTSSFDPITPWVDTITTSIDNISALIGFALEKPFPILQTIVANLGTYVGELTSGNAGLIPGQIVGNIGTLFTAPFDPGAVSDPIPLGPPGSGDEVILPLGTNLSQTGYANPEILSPFFLNNSALQIFVGQATSAECQIDGDCSGLPLTAQILSGTQSFGSGVAVGLLGPVLSPVAALINSVTAIVDYLSAGDFIGAINEVVNIPANLVNGFLNGAHLDLTPIVNLIAPGIAESVGLNLGGLISPPVPLNGSFTDPADPPTEFSGGTLLDAATATLARPTVEAPGVPGGIGPIGSLIGMGQYLSEELLVTPPEAPAATEVAAAVEPAPAEETPALDGVEVTAAVAETAATARAGEKTAAASAAAPGAAESVAESGAATPAADTSAATTRAARGSAAAPAADVRSGDNDRATHRGQRGAR